jgi:tetratricopeptide (TPR) repeat protein
MKVLLFIFLSVLIIKPTSAQSLASPAIGKSANLCSLATRQYLSGKSEESIALYQKAIAKAESEFGKNSRVAGDLYYQLGVRAFWLSKFNLAEYSFKKAVEINPNSEAAQLMLINLLRFRNRDTEAYGHIQQALKKHPDSASLRKDLVISLQDKDPLRAAKQAYLVTCVQNGITEKALTVKQDQPVEPKKAEEKEPSEKPALKESLTKPDNLTNKKAKTPANQISKSPNNKAPVGKPQNNKAKISKPQTEPQTASKAIYEPIKNIMNTITKAVKPKKALSSHKGSNKLPLGLVPPPPPDTMGFPSSARGGMRARAESIKFEKAQPAKTTEESQKPAAEHPAAESDPDFLIEWASVKKKHPASK